MSTHDLKTWTSEFEAIKAGHKKFDVRQYDRDFAVDDVLVLRKWDPHTGLYRTPSGRHISSPDAAEKLICRVTYIIHGGRCNLPPGTCVMSIDVYERAVFVDDANPLEEIQVDP